MPEANRINSHLTVSATDGTREQLLSDTKLLAFEGPAGARTFSCHIARQRAAVRSRHQPVPPHPRRADPPLRLKDPSPRALAREATSQGASSARWTNAAAIVYGLGRHLNPAKPEKP